MRLRVDLLLLALTFLVVIVGSATGKTWVVPHVFDTSGKTSTTTYTFDTFLHFAYAGGLPGAGVADTADVELYLFNNDGSVTQSSAMNDVCNPCAFTMHSRARHTIFSVEDEFIDAGGMIPVYLGFLVIVVGGDAEAVGIQSFIVNSKASPAEVSTFGFVPQELTAVAAASSPLPSSTTLENGTLVYPHLPENSGDTGVDPNSFDSSIFFLYGAGLPGAPPPGPVGASQIDIYLYDEATETPLKSASNADVCNPCTEVVGTASPKATFRVHEKIIAAGGFASPAQLAYAVVVISGDGPVATEGFIVNSKTGPFDISIAGVEGQLVTSGSPTSVGAGGDAPTLRLRAAPNPFNPFTRLTYTVGEPGPVRLDIVTVTGQLVATIVDDRRDTGTYKAVWDGTNRDGHLVSSGMYFARMTAPDGFQTRKLVLIK